METQSQQRCPRCGLPKEQWRGNDGEGFRAEDGTTYCCDGCARQQACICLEVLTREVQLEDDVKGPAEEPAQMEHHGNAPLPPGQVGHGSGTSGQIPAPRVNESPFGD